MFSALLHGFFGLIRAHLHVAFGAWAFFWVVGTLASKTVKRAGATVLGVFVSFAIVGKLWKNRRDVGQGIVVTVIVGTVVLWALVLYLLPGYRVGFFLAATLVALFGLFWPAGLPWRWVPGGYVYERWGNKPFKDVFRDWFEGHQVREQVRAEAGDDASVGRPRRTETGWDTPVHIHDDPTTALNPHAIGGRLNHGATTVRDVQVTPHAEMGMATVSVSTEAPPVERSPWAVLAEMGPVAWRGPYSAHADAPVPVGFDIHGNTLYVSGPAPDGLEHVGVAGATRRGKSATIASAIAEYACRPNVALILLDPQGVEFSPWTPRATRVYRGIDECRQGVADIYAMGNRRAERVTKLGRRTAPLAPDWPRIVVVSDEVAQYADNKTKEGREAGAWLTLISEGLGKFGIQLWLATQRPEVGVWEGRLRDNLLARVGHRHSSGEGSRMTTGPGGPDLTSIPKSLRGAFLMLSDEEWVAGRGFLLTPRGRVPDDDKSEALAYAAAEIAEATKALRVPWEVL